MADGAAGFAGGASGDEGDRADGAERLWLDDDFPAADGLLLASGIALERATGQFHLIAEYFAAAGREPRRRGDGGAALLPDLDRAEFPGVLYTGGGERDGIGAGAGAGGQQ